MRHEGFTPIGQIAETATGASQPEVGRHAGKAGAVASPSDIAGWLARQTPADMDRAAVWRASQHGVELQVRYEGRYPQDAPSYTVAVGCAVSRDGNHAAAARDLRNFLTPAPIRDIEGWLAELSVLVARRRADEFEDTLRLTAYASRLAIYPADVARDAVLQHSWHFWPTCRELERVCEAATTARRCMVAALERGPDPEPPAYRPPTDVERARMADLVAELFPVATPAMRETAPDGATIE